jgi:hypothetical protein
MIKNRIDLQERVMSYDLETQLQGKRIVLNFKPLKNKFFKDKFVNSSDPFCVKEFREVGIPLAKEITGILIDKIIVYQSKLVVLLTQAASIEDAFFIYSEFSKAFNSLELTNPSFEFNIYLVPKQDLYNFLLHFKMMWDAFIFRTLGEIYEVATKKDKTLSPSQVLERVLAIDETALDSSRLPDGIRHGVIVNSKGELFQNE